MQELELVMIALAAISEQRTGEKYDVRKDELVLVRLEQFVWLAPRPDLKLSRHCGMN